MAETKRTAPIQVGDFVALGLDDGSCPVGAVEAMDESWLAVRLMSMLTMELMIRVRIVRWDDILAVEAVYAEDGRDGVMPVDDLIKFQRKWNDKK